MKIVCAPTGYSFDNTEHPDLVVVLYGRSPQQDVCSTGAAVKEQIRKHKLQPARRAWDLLSIALSVISADLACRRDGSPDGWTRQLELQMAVSEPEFWNDQKALIEKQLRFLTTDIWKVSFLEDRVNLVPQNQLILPEQDSVVLLSGGLDSLVGALDLVTAGKTPYAVSQTTQGDKEKQSQFAQKLGGGLPHIQLNHNARPPGRRERSQRSRSLIFLAYGVLVATSLGRYHAGEGIKLYMCENGFISINPPLTGSRLGSLSTRTTHPAYLQLFQQLLDTAGLRVHIQNPYQFKTKGEMVTECLNQSFLTEYAHMTTSCSRYATYGYKHCGRCLPCLIRRAAFYKWVGHDKTDYAFTDLGIDNEDHARYDDVRAVAMAIAQAKIGTLDEWLGTSLRTVLLGDVAPYKDVLRRGILELEDFLQEFGVK